MTVTGSYVGRLGHHLVQNLDVAMPTNLSDPTSGQTYFQAATAFDKMVDQGVDPATVPDSGYFHNLFPNFKYEYKVLTPTTGLYWYGAQAYYANFANNRGNETNTLFAADTDSTASAGGQSFRFFYPQTSSVYVQSTTGISNYHALQLSIRQALRYGLEYDVNYTLSKSMDEGSDPEWNGKAGSIIVNSSLLISGTVPPTSMSATTLPPTTLRRCPLAKAPAPEQEWSSRTDCWRIPVEWAGPLQQRLPVQRSSREQLGNQLRV